MLVRVDVQSCGHSDMHQNPGNRARRCARSGAVRYGIMRAVRRGASFGLSFEFLSDPWLCAHQQATGKVNPATVQRRSAAVADAFTPPFTPVSSACAVNVS